MAAVFANEVRVMMTVIAAPRERVAVQPIGATHHRGDTRVAELH